jgi:hemerythrin superfamily protein
MTIYECLKKDHKTVEGLLNKLVKSSEGGTENWKKVIDQIRDELIPHARAEEAVLYNALRDADESKSLVAHSYGEHAMAETELRMLQAMKVIDVNWTALAEKLRHDLLHHVEEEESKVFAAAHSVFSNAEAIQMGKAFEKMKPAIREQSLTGTTIDMVANLLPVRLTASFRKFFESEEKRSA